MKKLTFDNFKIRNKLLLIYIFCVLLPIIVTDAIILYTVNQSEKEKQFKELQYVMERVEYNLRETVKGCILFTSNLYNDRVLDKFLNTRYEDYVTYYTAYMDLLNNNSLSYNYNNGILYKIQVYTDNDTILSGGQIAKVKTVRDNEWYQEYKESGYDIYLYTYYDEAKKSLAGSGTSRTISIIRTMDYFGNNGIEKFLKIDIDYNYMLKDVMNEKVDANIYVRNQEHVLFSNLPNENSMKNYESSYLLDAQVPSLTKSFKNNNETWEIFIVSETPPIFSVLFENKGIMFLILWNILIPSVLIYFVGKSISQRLSLIANAMDKVKEEHFEVIHDMEGVDEIGKLIRSYNLMVRKIRNLIEVVFKENAEKQALELSKKQAELKAVQSQVNPHFLFNTLETIRMRSFLKKENETADIIGQLAILFRKSMDWRSDYTTIKEEVSFVEKYINIQKYRFGEKILFHHNIMDDCLNFYVPKLGIATFIENACVHGIEATTSDGVITLNIAKDKDYLYIEICDNGKGIEEEKLKEIQVFLSSANNNTLYEANSTGILNAFLRFKMYCEGKIDFYVDSMLERGTDIRIKIPLKFVK